MFDKHRSRRIIYNDDGDQQWQDICKSYGYDVTNEQSFIGVRTGHVVGTQVDTYVWCLGNGCDTPYVGLGKLHPFLRSSDHAADVIIEACHALGLEAWGSLRMNDIHDSFMADSLETTHDPLKGRHPEYLIAPEGDRQLPDELTERYLWTAFNFARPEVREYRLNFIERTASTHDFDGYELDFTRFVWYFKLGEERAHADEMTDLIREARARLNAIGESRNRPYTFAVHMVDSVELSLQLGLDVETWLSEGLVDVLVVGMGYMPYALRLDQWLALGRRYGVPVYPSVNTNTYTTWWQDRFRQPERWHDSVRAGAAFHLQEGADGLYFFNLFCQEDENIASMQRDFLYEPMREVGSLATLVGRDKLYSIQPVEQGGFCHHGSEATPLPIALDRTEHKLPLMVGPDADDPGASFTLSLWLSPIDCPGDTRIQLRLNHTLLPAPVRNDAGNDLYHTEVPSGIVRKGYNELSVWCNVDVTKAERPVVVHQVFLSAKYGKRV